MYLHMLQVCPSPSHLLHPSSTSPSHPTQPMNLSSKMSAGLLQKSILFSSHRLEGSYLWCPWKERMSNKWSGNCSLFAKAYRQEDTSKDYASLWEREEGNSRHSKVASLQTPCSERSRDRGGLSPVHHSESCPQQSARTPKMHSARSLAHQ